MKNCPHSRDHWHVSTVEDYERVNGKQPWLDGRPPSDIISAFCDTCERWLTFGESNDGPVEDEIRVAEIVYGMDHASLDDGVKVTNQSVTVTVAEYRGICGYLCPLTFTPIRHSEAEIGWFAAAIIELEDPPYEHYSFQHSESDLDRRFAFAALIVDEFFAQKQALRDHERARHRYDAELEAKIGALEARLPGGPSFESPDLTETLRELAAARAECPPVWEDDDDEAGISAGRRR